MHQDAMSSCGSRATGQVITGWAENADDFSMQNIADSHHWMAVTMIEDDDLMFDNKPLCTWYEEGRRRYSSGDNDNMVLSPSSSVEEEEELHRGRQRDRPQYQKPPTKHHKTASSSKSDDKSKH
ncbi:hypothetical protein CMQ_4543 [Grosmannia clavigera kw1407]|uniref:Uncharacterized protein n=1 Tax=Grosmannia clavigera (strain kw1407 / UAMH 11150) TaxID=655863 RepID=F0XV31_GROCL|nr:uncharacterized protein CMQ_4543 [Grosmannia clavigera kw1407]EFW98691.1 hypothetical protein CMQ_4543 [Grosmannia clavigera kw1407]